MDVQVDWPSTEAEWDRAEAREIGAAHPERAWVAWDFRVGLIGEAGSPEGMCFAVSSPLAGLLNFYGMPVELVESDHSDHPATGYLEHWWIKLPDGRVLDPTFDQFCSEEPVPIYIGQPTEFHREIT